MILTIVSPFPSKEGFVIEHSSYADSELRRARDQVTVRLRERWASEGEIWLLSEGALSLSAKELGNYGGDLKEDIDLKNLDGVLLEKWTHLTGNDHDLVLELDKINSGETK